MTDKKELLLTEIANNLLIRSAFENNLGLFHGRMGIIIFFCHYASFTKNDLYHQVAKDLIHDLFEDIHNRMSFDFENGYCGIGWGFEYLMQHNFITNNSQNILEDIDLEIMKIDVKRLIGTYSTFNLSDILHYILSRLSDKENCYFFDERYLDDLYRVCKQVISTEAMKDHYNLANSFILYREKDIIDYSTDSFLNSILFNLPVSEICDCKKLGLVDGCSGYGLKLILHG